MKEKPPPTAAITNEDNKYPKVRKVQLREDMITYYLELRKSCLFIRARLDDDDEMKKYLADVADTVNKALIKTLC